MPSEIIPQRPHKPSISSFRKKTGKKPIAGHVRMGKSSILKVCLKEKQADMEWLMVEKWSPYVVGIGIGILSWLAILVSDRTIGCSTPFSRVSGMIERLFRGDKVLEKPYYRKIAPVFGWDVILILGILVGAFISAGLSGQFRAQWVPDLWATTFGQAPLPRLIVAFIGGILMGVGSRWAGGCTSGHGISGTLQLALSSWLAAICFFISGIVTALLIFRVFAG
jgi:uncharacterized membrane protein YedE/YeeE